LIGLFFQITVLFFFTLHFVHFYFYLFGSCFFLSFVFTRPSFCEAQNFSATIFKIRLSFCEAQKFSATIFQIRLSFVRRRSFPQQFFKSA